MAGEMPRKFKIGAIVFYRPKQRMLSTGVGRTQSQDSCRCRSQQPEYRIRHFSEDFELVRSRMSYRLASLSMAKMTTPRPYKVYERGTYATRAEARRAQQRLAASKPEHNFVIMDILGHVVS